MLLFLWDGWAHLAILAAKGIPLVLGAGGLISLFLLHKHFKPPRQTFLGRELAKLRCFLRHGKNGNTSWNAGRQEGWCTRFAYLISQVRTASGWNYEVDKIFWTLAGLSFFNYSCLRAHLHWLFWSGLNKWLESGGEALRPSRQSGCRIRAQTVLFSLAVSDIVK